MRRYACLIFPALVILILITSAHSDDLPTARVVGVANGNRITVIDTENNRIDILLHGIDCPELGQAFGIEAKHFTSAQCFGKTVQYRLVGIDRFHRTIATVYLDDGRELNLAIVEAGFAWHYRRYANGKKYADAEDEARRRRIGLWADPNPTPPWEWRRKKKP